MESKKDIHVGLIMDGNRRWAEKHNLKPWHGHEEGKNALKKIVRHFSNNGFGIKYLTLYALSLDNVQKRSETERKFLYDVFKQGFIEILEEPFIFGEKVNINIIGRLDMIPDKGLKDVITKAIDSTKGHSNKFIRFAICYDGQDEIVNAVQSIVEKGTKKITAETIKQNMFTKDMPPVDFMIRTGGEQRLSGFLLWDASYAELYFTETLFPDFNPDSFDSAIKEYLNRQRRFGK